MAYEIRAILSNRRHQEYGQVSVPFPIPSEEYDHILELLRPMEIGAAATQDCMIDEIDSPFPVLKRLENSVVYRYCLRCNPNPGDYQAYLTCFDKQVQEMNQSQESGPAMTMEGL